MFALMYEPAPVTGVEALFRELECGICGNLLCRSVTLSCMHTFCRDCIVTARAYTKRCPLCHAVPHSDTRVVLALENTIDQLLALHKTPLEVADLHARRIASDAHHRGRVVRSPVPDRFTCVLVSIFIVFLLWGVWLLLRAV